MSPLVTLSTVALAEVETVVDEVMDLDALERAWHGPDNTPGKSTSKINNAQLTVMRNTGSDFQDRQVYLYVDGELWGKVKYGRPMTREIPPGPHKVRAFNTLFSHTIEVNAVPGEHVKLICSNGLPKAGFLMFIFFHCTALRVRLERE
jgi:hypothetical protein